jgi:hypothetical protein
LNQETVLITFGAGSSGWTDAAQRLRKEANACGLFAQVEIFDQKWIQDFEPKLWYQIQDYFNANQPRGFGYWIWKPALLYWADKKWPDKQILYVDAGFHIDEQENLIYNFRDFLRTSFEKGGVAFEQIGLKEEYWTKREIFDYFNCNYNDTQKNQLYAGFILMAPGEKRTQFTQEFYSLTKFKNGFLFNDVRYAEQSAKFIEPRHDQSIFSILWRKYGLSTTPDLTTISNIGNFLLIAARNRTGMSATKPKSLLKLIRLKNKIRDIMVHRG